VKRHGMQETDYVLKEGEYREVVFEMRRNNELTRIDSGPISKNIPIPCGIRRHAVTSNPACQPPPRACQVRLSYGPSVQRLGFIEA
jgi:hypothetical protein